MRYQYDLLVIGLGPAGIVAATTANKLGLKVCALEKKHIGGECLNVGCIPSKALLRIAKTKHTMEEKIPVMELDHGGKKAKVRKPFNKIAAHIEHIREKNSTDLFQGIDIFEETVSFIDSNTVQAGTKTITAHRIFISIGTRPLVPNIQGLDSVPYLTTDNFFNLREFPESMIILGAGATGVEMAQAFSRLGVKCYLVHADPHIIPLADPAAAKFLAEVLQAENVTVHNQQKITGISLVKNEIKVTCADGLEVSAEKLFVVAGRTTDFTELNLPQAGVDVDSKGFIKVNNHLQTSQKNIYAIGDCNGKAMFSGAAMHQGLIALFNTMRFSPFKLNYNHYVVPWTVFTEPHLSSVGMTEQQLLAENITFQTIQVDYKEYGAAIAESVDVGFAKVFVGDCGKIYGAVIIGEGAGEMIHEWAYAIQHKLSMRKVLMTQHSFPTMSCMNRLLAEKWLLQQLHCSCWKKLCQFLYRC